MNCPYCTAQDSKVLDSRKENDGLSVKRRRKCESCGKRFTTYEHIEIIYPMVVKNDGRRETFNREKILLGLKKACQKRPISTPQIMHLLENIEKHILELNSSEVTTRFIGNLIMNYLRHLDPVAYVRFASVYRTFQDIDEFVNELKFSRESKEGEC